MNPTRPKLWLLQTATTNYFGTSEEDCLVAKAEAKDLDPVTRSCDISPLVASLHKEQLS